MATPYRKYSEVGGSSVPDVPFEFNRTLREIDADVQRLAIGSRLDPIPADSAVASYLTTSGTDSEIAARGLVVEALASDSAPIQAAAAAVTQEIAGRDMLESTDERIPRNMASDDLKWAVTDNRYRAALGVSHDGEVHAYGRLHADGGVSLGGANFATMDEASGAVAGFTDGERLSELVIDASGSLPRWAAERIVARGLGAGSGRIFAGPGIAAWGDSITQTGGNSASWISYCAATLDVPFFNGGWISQTAQQAAGRQGGARATVTVTGGAIPGSGPVAVSTNPRIAVYPNSSRTGVHGRLAVANITGTISEESGAQTFTRDDSGDPIPLTGSDVFIPTDGESRREWAQVYWVGRNGTTDVAGIVASVRQMIAYQSAPAPRFVVLQILPGEGWADPTEANNALVKEWPENYLRIADWLKTNDAAIAAGITFTTDDAADIAAGWVPRSFRTDAVHLNTAANRAVARRVADYFIEKGWV